MVDNVRLTFVVDPDIVDFGRDSRLALVPSQLWIARLCLPR